ncbi:hypothetical protein [Sphingobacterium thalpophilum]|uniref:hypothetical protein n=1 Tax=Sphingobacterium thalpophilum TaxID=259 RepID=UPI003C74825B
MIGRGLLRRACLALLHCCTTCSAVNSPQQHVNPRPYEDDGTWCRVVVTHAASGRRSPLTTAN